VDSLWPIVLNGACYLRSIEGCIEKLADYID
jgi:hypothetical protein